ncbi:hypothetical protein [Leptothoe sp. PORK10 BA2]|uniref:hypothetical protein n=1 Tax=Leptothoe sp. PORK10 BA2 TaxID=3110254 RepID=UPI002B21AF7A|nr:hypothetical protein [Leptothoe sp. PORK10 BA2]MEA5464784.1 hypothetical protein [Leptothoe sp. PORK10 BA2]
MISTLFAQFRHQYANGGLSTELLMTHAEQYLVKATVTLDGQVIATALGADVSLIAADDQAKLRVLSLLGFGQPSQNLAQLPANTNGLPLVLANLPPTQTIAKATVAASTSIAEPDPTLSSLPAAGITSSAYGSNAALAPEVDESEDIGRPIDSITPDEAPAPSDVPASSLAAAAIENFDDTHPVDLSDVIAQTDVEMSRLGWSSLQGRSYLEKTFQKHSRQQLTDEELLTFLLYLESQSTPIMG